MFQPDHIKEMISPEQIAARIVELGAEIARDYEGMDLAVVGVLKGSFIFLADLVRQIPLPLTVDFLGLSSYGDEETTSGVVKITSDLSKPIAGRHVLIVEDIVDTGLTLSYLMKNLSTRHPASLKICTLLHKPARTEVDVSIDYKGFTIEDRFVIGYGLDDAQRYRNVPYIGEKIG